MTRILMYFNSIEHSNLPTYPYLNIKINLKINGLLNAYVFLLNPVFTIDLFTYVFSEVTLLLAELHTLIIMFVMISIVTLSEYLYICTYTFT